MAIAPGSLTRVAFVPEVTWGTTPATPSFVALRRTGGSLATSKATAMTDEVRPDRNVSDLLQLGQDVAGSYDFEMSYASYDPLFEAVLCGAWTTNVLKNGIVEKSFSFEETTATGSGAEQYSRFVGAEVNTLSLNVTARQKITGSLGLMAKVETLDTAPITGATYTAAGVTPIMTASANVASLTLGSLSSPKVRSLTLNATNNMRTRETVANLYSERFGLGRFEVTGSAELYFETNDAYAAALAHGGGALAFTIGNASGSKYTIEVPKFIFGDAKRNTGGNTSDVMVTLPFTGVYDSGTACTMKITRAVT